jgi:membrane associated rhomboid family serine protease
LTGCIVIVGAVQVFTVIQGKSSILAAGIVKSAVWQGEIWRLLTGTLLHGNIIHFLFNILALFGLSKLIEVTAHRVYLPIIFLLSALSGSLASLIFLPNVNSVGASGGIMGLVGFLMVLVGKNRRFLPSKFFRGLLLAVFLTLATGLLASQIIDNAAHLGGLLGGIMLGVCLIPQHQPTLPIAVSSALSRIGILASVVIGTIAIVACLKMLFS